MTRIQADIRRRGYSLLFLRVSLPPILDICAGFDTFLAMERRAIILGANNATSTHLNGVDSDMRRLIGHLTSEFGGAWERNEILYLKAPSPLELGRRLDAVRREQPDYLMIAFSGHGFENKNGESFVVLRDREYFAVSDLEAGVARQVTIVDACRVSVQGSLVERTIKTAGAGDVSGIGAWDYRGSCRAQFDACLRRVASGSALLQSCSVGQSSSDYPSGGLFMHSLITLARTAASDVSDWQQSTRSGSVSNSFGPAQVETRRLNPRQIPTFTVQGQGASLPFVVA